MVSLDNYKAMDVRYIISVYGVGKMKEKYGWSALAVCKSHWLWGNLDKSEKYGWSCSVIIK
ncbi:Mitochondrial translation factor ATP22 [Bienertia sinuspersici]